MVPTDVDISLIVAELRSGLTLDRLESICTTVSTLIGDGRVKAVGALGARHLPHRRWRWSSTSWWIDDGGIGMGTWDGIVVSMTVAVTGWFEE
jgi:hypothetical protein